MHYDCQNTNTEMMLWDSSLYSSINADLYYEGNFNRLSRTGQILKDKWKIILGEILQDSTYSFWMFAFCHVWMAFSLEEISAFY